MSQVNHECKWINGVDDSHLKGIIIQLKLHGLISNGHLRPII